MWKKHFPSSQSLPIEDNNYYITIESLKKCKYGETIELTEVLSNNGTYKIEDKESRSSEKLFLSHEKNVFKTTFIRYRRLDGKPEETRLDHIQQVDNLTAKALI